VGYYYSEDVLANHYPINPNLSITETINHRKLRPLSDPRGAWMGLRNFESDLDVGRQMKESK
jgi:hypothetical protein